MSTEVVVHQPGVAKTFALGPNQVTFLLSAEETGGIYSLSEFAAAPPPAPAAPTHNYRDADETLYIVEGECQFTINEETIPAPAGSYVFIPKGTPHTVANIGTKVAKILVILTPPGFENFWRERAQQIAEFGNEVDPELVRALQEKYHFDVGGQVRQFNNP